MSFLWVFYVLKILSYLVSLCTLFLFKYSFSSFKFAFIFFILSILNGGPLVYNHAIR